MVFRRDVIALLKASPRTASSLARELGLRRTEMDEELGPSLRSAQAAGHAVLVEPARCRACGFVFDTNRLTKPSKCPACRGTRVFEPLVRIELD